MAQIYAPARKPKLFAYLLLKCMLFFCVVVNGQAQAPTITSFSPMSGRVGDYVEIIGTGYNTANRVYFGNGSTTVFEILDNGTKIRVQVPVTSNPGRVRVNNANGYVLSKTTEIFEMPFAPTLTSLSSNSGVPGDEVTFNGTNLGGVTRVFFGSGSTTAISVVNNNQIKAIVPATATTARPIVQSNEGRATSTVNFDIIGSPTISSFSPISGAVGTPVTIKGTNLEGATRVYFGSGSTTVFTIQSGDIIVEVPPTATTGAVRVQTNGGQASRSTFTVEGAPIVTGISPLQGNAGTTLTITGQNIKDAFRVYVGGGSTTEITVIDDNTISIVVPVGASTSTVRVQSNNGQGSSSQTFEVLSSPVIENFTPTSGPVNTEVTITGQNLLNATSVSFSGGSVTSANFISKTDNEIKVAVPSTAYSGAITVISTTGRHTSSLLYNVEGAPFISSFTPESGATGSIVTISGQSLLNATHVYIGSGSVLAKDFISKTDDEIKVNVPTLASTGSIRVTTTNGQFTTAGLYTVETAPVITSFSPGSGYLGSPLTITGQNFTGATRVYVGSGSITTGFTVSPDGTTINLNVPNNATTGTLRVWTTGGQVTSVGTYVVLPPSIIFNPNPITFSNVPANSSEVKSYQLSGEGLTNGVPVSLNIADPSTPFEISSSETGTYSRSLSISGIVNNRLNPVTVWVKYSPLAQTADGAPHTGSIVHSQGSTSRSLPINATAAGPMPVELASFTAKTKNSEVILEWKTASEENNSHFDVEMSVGSLKNFAKVATVASKVGNSTTITNYKYQQHLPNYGQTVYFRLKQVDFDGTHSYSKIVAVETSGQQANVQATVVPNPVNGESRLIITSLGGEKASIQLSSLAGKRLLQKEVSVRRGQNEIELPMLGRLESGMYILTVSLDGNVQKVKLIKK